MNDPAGVNVVNRQDRLKESFQSDSLFSLPRPPAPSPAPLPLSSCSYGSVSDLRYVESCEVRGEPPLLLEQRCDLI